MAPSVITWPAPAGEIPSPDYAVEANGVPLFVHQARVRAEILQNDGLWTHRADCTGERASFVIFDMTGPATLRIRPARPFTRATVLPERAGLSPRIADGCIELDLDRPRKLTVLPDGDDRAALHLFAGEPEKDAPQPGDPNVVYLGPGVHETHGLQMKSGQTLYLAGGAVLKASPPPGDRGTYSDKWKVTFFNGAVFSLKGVEDVCIRGRGIVDASLVPHPGFNMLRIDGAKRVRIEGVTLRDSANWNFVIGQSQDVEVEDVRIVSGRLNSDGINSVNSRRVRIRNCFVRNHDDSIVVKTTAPGAAAEDILVEDCTVWSDWGYSLGVTYETRAPVRRVAFRGCNLIYTRHWCLGLHLSDSATVEDITFADIHVSDLAAARGDAGARAALTADPKLMRFVVTQDCWGHDAERGRIRNVSVDGVTVHGDALPGSEMEGVDAAHDVRGVTVRNVRLAGRPAVTDAAGLGLRQNAFVHDLRIEAR